MKKIELFGLLLTGLCVFLFIQCGTGPKTVSLQADALPYKKLSEYGFFKGPPAGMAANDRVVPYELITPLFTDYAHKARYVWMPEGTSATVDEEGTVQFPDQSVLIKTFYYPADFSDVTGKKDLVETRLLVKTEGKWDAYTYIWNDNQSDAQLSLVGGYKDVQWKDEAGQPQEVQYVIPNKNQCKSCHNLDNKVQPIGPKARNLNQVIRYPDGAERNQLDYWQETGLLKAGDWKTDFPAVADWEDPESGSLHERALAYLDVNCAHCHNERGPAHTTGLYLTYHQTDPGKLGVCKTPVAAGKGSGGRKVGIQPGDPEASILLFRMEENDPGIMMPEIGRVRPHMEGIQLVREWIEAMEGDCAQLLQ
jgi:uncharacterized repeat protein (TIGR03806 family)